MARLKASHNPVEFTVFCNPILLKVYDLQPKVILPPRLAGSNRSLMRSVDATSPTL